MLAIFLTIKASPGWKFSMWEGHTRESEQANTKNCIFFKYFIILLLINL